MKQLLLRKGAVLIEDVPAPARHPRQVLVEVTHSLISTGTEMSSVQLSQASLLEKAKKKPEAVVKVMSSIKVRGVARTWALVQSELDQSKPLGYSCAGRVLAVGKDVSEFQVGDRVACAGANLANHAELVSVPANLVVKVPVSVSDKNAAFVTIGAIAMQGVRRADVRLGETVAVVGLGLIGQITVQLLTAAGCRVIGMDVADKRVQSAIKAGMVDGATSNEELRKKISLLTQGVGVDATLITASTDSSEPTQNAFEITRKKGKIIVVGAVGLDLKRSPFYEKEQDFLISCSYGPGRYDAKYELEGQDYPLPYVRWTENRNMGSFLDLIAQGHVNVESLIDAEYDLAKSSEAYEALAKTEGPKPLAIVLNYPSLNGEREKTAPVVEASAPKPKAGKVRLGLIGVGNFTKTTHVPNIQKRAEKVDIAAVCTANGSTASTLGRQLKASLIATDYQEVIKDANVDAVLIATRHNRHAEMTEAALKSGKHVYLEKPLALELSDVDALDKTMRELKTRPILMVGFNRRFSPFARRLGLVLSGRTTPLVATYRVNAGRVPADHWTNSAEGGGRLRGEACHMVDFFQYLVGAKLESIDVQAVHGSSALARPDENFSAQFSYADGSVCNLIYTSLGHEALPKERVECHWDGMSAVLDDFRQLSFYGLKENIMAGRQDKGHLAAFDAFISSILSGGAFPVAWEQLLETTRATIELDQKVWGRLPD